MRTLPDRLRAYRLAWLLLTAMSTCIGLQLAAPTVQAQDDTRSREDRRRAKKKRKKKARKNKPSKKRGDRPVRKKKRRKPRKRPRREHRPGGEMEGREKRPPRKAPKQGTRTSAQDSASAAAAAAEADIVREGDEEVKVMRFSGLDVEGRLKSPQLLYFESRVRAEFDRPSLPHRSFMPELARSTHEDTLR